MSKYIRSYARQVVIRLAKKYNANKAWLWSMLTKRYGISEGSYKEMNVSEMDEFEVIVKYELEKSGCQVYRRKKKGKRDLY